MGLFLATFVNWLFTSGVSSVADNSNVSWRLVFASALLPLIATALIRWKVKESSAWERSKARALMQRKRFWTLVWDEARSVKILFSPRYRHQTVGALTMVMVALIDYWSCSAFVPMVSNFLASQTTPAPATSDDLQSLKAYYVVVGTSMFNLGGLIGSALTVPSALYLGRRWMFVIYFTLGSVSIFMTFSPYVDISPYSRLYVMMSIGMTIFGIFGSFTFYLPELFPLAVRASGCGFSFNVGRFVAAIGPFVVGVLGSRGGNPMEVIQFVAVVPLIGAILALAKVAPETKNHSSFDSDHDTLHESGDGLHLVH